MMLIIAGLMCWCFQALFELILCRPNVWWNRSIMEP